MARDGIWFNENGSRWWTISGIVRKHLESQVQLYITSGEPYKGGCRYSVYQADNLLISQLPYSPTDLRAHPNTRQRQDNSKVVINPYRMEI
jgi:hypothetical protein